MAPRTARNDFIRTSATPDFSFACQREVFSAPKAVGKVASAAAGRYAVTVALRLQPLKFWGFCEIWRAAGGLVQMTPALRSASRSAAVNPSSPNTAALSCPSAPPGQRISTGCLREPRKHVVHAHGAAVGVGNRDRQQAGAPVGIALDVGDRLHRRGGQGIGFDDREVLGQGPRGDGAFDDLRPVRPHARRAPGWWRSAGRSADRPRP